MIIRQLIVELINVDDVEESVESGEHEHAAQIFISRLRFPRCLPKWQT